MGRWKGGITSKVGWGRQVRKARDNWKRMLEKKKTRDRRNEMGQRWRDGMERKRSKTTKRPNFYFFPSFKKWFLIFYLLPSTNTYIVTVFVASMMDHFYSSVLVRYTVLQWTGFNNTRTWNWSSKLCKVDTVTYKWMNEHNWVTFINSQQEAVIVCNCIFYPIVVKKKNN